MSVVPRTRPSYPPEFRREAVELVLAGRSVKDVAGPSRWQVLLG
jgi:transposase